MWSQPQQRVSTSGGWPDSGGTQAPFSEGQRVLVKPDQVVNVCRMHLRPPYSFDSARMHKYIGLIGCVRKVYPSGPIAVSFYERREASATQFEAFDKEMVRVDWVWHPGALRPAGGSAHGDQALLQAHRSAAVRWRPGDLCLVNEHLPTLTRLHNGQLPQQILHQLCGSLVRVVEAGPPGRLCTRVSLLAHRADGADCSPDQHELLSDCLVPVYEFALVDGKHIALVASDCDKPDDEQRRADRLFQVPLVAEISLSAQTEVARACINGGPNSDTVVAQFAAHWPHKIDTPLPSEQGGGYSALMLAAQFNQTNMINLLWRFGGAKLTHQSPVDGRNAFHLAVENGCLPALVTLVAAALEQDESGQLLRAGLQAVAHGAGGSTPVHSCVAAMNDLRFKPHCESTADAVAEQIEYGVPPPDVDWDTVCIDPANDTHPPLCLKRMLDSRACDLSIQDEHGYTPLHQAAMAVCTSRVGFEPDSGVVHADIAFMFDALLAAAPPQLAALKETHDGGTVLHLAVRHGALHAVELICRRHASLVCVPNDSEMSPLHVAALNGFANVLHVMLEAASQVGQTLSLAMRALCRAGRTPLHYAVTRPNLPPAQMQRSTRERFRCVELLLERGADPTASDGLGYTPLHLAAKELNAHAQSHHALLAAQLPCAAAADPASYMDTCPWLGVALLLATRGGGAQVLDAQSKRPLDYLDASIRDRLTPIFQCFDDSSRVSASPAADTMNSLSQRLGGMQLLKCVCCACNNAPAVVVARPCGHPQLCAACLASGQGRRCCAHCRATVDEYVHAPAAATEGAEQRTPSIECAICMDEPIRVMFQCGHTACDTCARRIHVCHVCRRHIQSRNTIYL